MFVCQWCRRFGSPDWSAVNAHEHSCESRPQATTGQDATNTEAVKAKEGRTAKNEREG